MPTRSLLLPLAAAALIGGAGGAGVSDLARRPPPPPAPLPGGPGAPVAPRWAGAPPPPPTAAGPPPPTAPPAEPVSQPAHGLTAGQVYQRSKDSVAYIRARTAQGGATGSGFVI